MRALIEGKESIIRIHSGDYTASVNLSRGANCIELKNSLFGADILRTPDYSKELDNPFLYGMPILYPANRISDGKFVFEGREYVFPINESNTNCHIHGELHNQPFGLLDKGENFVSCVYESNGEYLGFPHKFKVVMNYSLSDGGLLQEVEIINLSDKNMPSFLGFHSTFNLPFVEGSDEKCVRVLAKVGDEIERDMNTYLPTGKILAEDEITSKLNSDGFEPFNKSLSRHYRSKAGGEIEIADLQKKVKTVIKYDEKFKFRLFYKQNENSKFICLEPMTGMANCQNSSFDREYAGFDFIAPKSSKKYISRIYVEKM